MIHEMEAHALDRPRFRATADQVSVELHRHGAEVPRLREWLRSLTDRPLSSPKDAALIMARREGVVTVARLRDDLRIDSDDARALLQNLVNLGLLRAVGTEAYKLWSGGPTLRRSELDVLDVLSIDHSRGISELAELLGKSPNTLRPVLRRLVALGEVTATAPASSRYREYLRAAKDGLKP